MSNKMEPVQPPLWYNAYVKHIWTQYTIFFLALPPSQNCKQWNLRRNSRKIGILKFQFLTIKLKRSTMNFKWSQLMNRLIKSSLHQGANSEIAVKMQIFAWTEADASLSSWALKPVTHALVLLWTPKGISKSSHDFYDHILGPHHLLLWTFTFY